MWTRAAGRKGKTRATFVTRRDDFMPIFLADPLNKPRRLMCRVFPSGGAAQQLPRYLRRAAADVHRSRGGRVRARHPGEHAQHGGYRPVHGRGQAAVHRSHSGEPPLLLPG